MTIYVVTRAGNGGRETFYFISKGSAEKFMRNNSGCTMALEYEDHNEVVGIGKRKGNSYETA